MPVPSATIRELDERSREVLASVVYAYIRSGIPVSSRQLTKTGEFSLSAASLRNAMADLEDLGLLTHPHTSSGRIPTDRGYRVYVSELMPVEAPSPEDLSRIASGLDAESFEMDRFLAAASRLLSRLTGEVGVVVAPDSLHFVLESVHFKRIASRKILVVQVSDSGLVEDHLIETREDYGQGELDEISQQLTAGHAGKTLFQIRRDLLRALREEKARADEAFARALDLGRRAFAEDRAGEAPVFVEGAETMLDKPEFQGDVEGLRRLFRALGERMRLVNLLTDCLEASHEGPDPSSEPDSGSLSLPERGVWHPGSSEELRGLAHRARHPGGHERGVRPPPVGGTSVVIGSEDPLTEELQSAVVTTAYRKGDRVVGALGVLGPRRMAYPRIVPIVEELGRYVTRRLTEQMS